MDIAWPTHAIVEGIDDPEERIPSVIFRHWTSGPINVETFIRVVELCSDVRDQVILCIPVSSCFQAQVVFKVHSTVREEGYTAFCVFSVNFLNPNVKLYI